MNACFEARMASHFLFVSKIATRTINRKCFGVEEINRCCSLYLYEIHSVVCRIRSRTHHFTQHWIQVWIRKNDEKEHKKQSSVGRNLMYNIKLYDIHTMANIFTLSDVLRCVIHMYVEVLYLYLYIQNMVWCVALARCLFFFLFVLLSWVCRGGYKKSNQ